MCRRSLLEEVVVNCRSFIILCLRSREETFVQFVVARRPVGFLVVCISTVTALVCSVYSRVLLDEDVNSEEGTGLLLVCS